MSITRSKNQNIQCKSGWAERTNHIASVSKELEEFEKVFCDSLTSIKEKFETSQVTIF